MVSEPIQAVDPAVPVFVAGRGLVELSGSSSASSSVSTAPQPKRARATTPYRPLFFFLDEAHPQPVINNINDTYTFPPLPANADTQQLIMHRLSLVVRMFEAEDVV